jgi:hypothetical protein
MKKPISELKAQPSLLELEIINLVEKAIKNSQIQLAADDIKIIAKEIMPDMDALIANKVKQHFYELGMFLVEKNCI